MKRLNAEKTIMVLLSVTVYIALCLFSSIDMPDGNKETIMAMLYSYNKNELINYGVLCSTGTILNSFRGMQWYLVLLPIIISLYPMRVIKERYFSHSYYYQVTRVGRRRYAGRYLLEAIGYAAVVNNLSLIIFFIIICMKFPWIENVNGVEMMGSINMISMAEICLMTTLVAVLLLCISLIIMNISADVFFAITLPMLMCYVGYKVLNIHLLHLRKQYGIDFPNSGLRWEILNPSFLIQADNMFETTFGMSVAVLYSVLSVVLIAMLYAIYRWMNRKVYG